MGGLPHHGGQRLHQRGDAHREAHPRHLHRGRRDIAHRHQQQPRVRRDVRLQGARRCGRHAGRIRSLSLPDEREHDVRGQRQRSGLRRDQDLQCGGLSGHDQDHAHSGHGHGRAQRHDGDGRLCEKRRDPHRHCRSRQRHAGRSGPAAGRAARAHHLAGQHHADDPLEQGQYGRGRRGGRSRRGLLALRAKRHSVRQRAGQPGHPDGGLHRHDRDHLRRDLCLEEVRLRSVADGLRADGRVPHRCGQHGGRRGVLPMHHDLWREELYRHHLPDGQDRQLSGEH